jgi:hypothetical protein
MYMPMTETYPVPTPVKDEEDGSSIDSREMIKAKFRSNP